MAFARYFSIASVSFFLLSALPGRAATMSLRVLHVMLALLAIVATADAQQAQKRPTVGFLWSGSAGSPSPLIEAFENGLRDLGWIKDKNVTVEYRYAEGKAERFPELVTELVQLPVDVIVAGPAPAAVAGKKATTTIPIVITLGADPLAFGLMENLTPQTGNITGLTEVMPELTPKRLTLLKEIMPALTRAAILSQPGILRAETFDQMVKQTKDTAQSLGVHLEFVEVRATNDLESAFHEMAKTRVEALVVLMSPMFNAQTKRLADLASIHRLPTVYEFRGYPAAGGFMSYGADFSDIYRRAATYVDRLLKGARPADLAVESPTKFELVINRKTAKTLGLEIPHEILQQADKVIE
jgi:putative tryptophan/tyrosine transport system substrate-binding protein